jgi:SAM-dependent methyltransferase
MQIETCVNTPDEVLFENVFTNPHKALPWLKSIPEHDGHAVIVGGGPSVLDWIEEIRWRQSIGQTIFALNGASNMLSIRGIVPDHQVIVDARKSNVHFLGAAKHHYLASQCDPGVVDEAKGVTLWHQQYPEDMEQFEAALPIEQPETALVGGGTTVGLSAMSLVYILGYRKIHLYGYDSSYRGEAGHAYVQNDSQAIPCKVTVAGKMFLSTLAMAQQAEFFPRLSDKLIDAGCIITLRGDGLLPWTSQQAAIKQEPSEILTEAEKYSRMYSLDAYRKSSPGEREAKRFVEMCGIRSWMKVIDFGCGTGRGGKAVHELAHCSVLQIDFSDFRDEGSTLPFISCDLMNLKMVKVGDVGYCVDMMEHPPPEHIDTILTNIMRAVQRCYFKISLYRDDFGALIGQELHLTVKPYSWWLDVLSKHGTILESYDEGITAVFYLSST